MTDMAEIKGLVKKFGDFVALDEQAGLVG